MANDNQAPVRTVSTVKFFVAMNCFERLLFIIGILGALVLGAGIPYLAKFFGEIVQIYDPTQTEQIMDKM